MRFLLDEMYGERVAEVLTAADHDAVHVRSVGLGGAADADVLAFAADDDRVVVTENASDFLPLLDERQAAGASMTAVLIAMKSGRGRGDELHHRLAVDLGNWAEANADPYRHAHWLA